MFSKGMCIKMSVKKEKRNGIDGYLIRLSTPNPFFNPAAPEGKENKRYLRKKTWIATTRKAEARRHEVLIKEKWIKEVKEQKSIEDNLTVHDYFIVYFETFKKGKYSISTDQQYLNAAGKVKRFLPHLLMKHLTKTHYQKFINALAERGSDEGEPLSKGSVQMIHAKVKQAINQALYDNVLSKDPTYKVEIVGGKPSKSSEQKFLELEIYDQLEKKLLDEFEEKIESRALFVQARTGMRIGEVLGITEDRIDFEANIILVDRQWNRRERKLTPTKNKKKRRVNVAPSTMSRIKQMIMINKRDRLKYGVTEGEMFLFPSLSHFMSRPIYQKYCLNRLKEHLADIYEVDLAEEGVRQQLQGTHALRHTQCSRLIKEGVNILAVAEQLGDSVQTIQKTYAHLMNDMNEETQRIITSMHG